MIKGSNQPLRQYDLVHVVDVRQVVLGVAVIVVRVDDGRGSMARLSNQGTCRPSQVLSDNNILDERRSLRHFGKQNESLKFGL